MMYVRDNGNLLAMATYEDIWSWFQYQSSVTEDFIAYEDMYDDMLRLTEVNYPEELEKVLNFEYEDLDNQFPFFTEEDYESLCRGMQLMYSPKYDWLDSPYDQEAFLKENQLTLF